MLIWTYISIITLNVNGLNVPTKWQTGWMNTKTRPIYILSTRNTLQTKEIYRLKVRGWKILFHANGKQNKAGVTILISDETDLKIKNTTKDKERHYIMIKGSIQYITIVNTYAPNIGAPQYIRQTLTDRHKRRNWQ